MNDLLETLLEAVRGMDPTTRTLIAMLGMFLETSAMIGLVIPGDSIALIASTGVTSVPQYVWLIVALLVGALAGETLGFFIGRFFGPKLRASRLGRRLGEKNWMLADLYLGDRGGIAVFVSRFLPVLHSLVPLTAGMTRMPYRTFLAWTAAASTLWATLYVSVGVGLAVSFDQLSGTLRWAGILFVLVVVLFGLMMWLIKRRLFATELAKHHDSVEELLATERTQDARRKKPKRIH